MVNTIAEFETASAAIVNELYSLSNKRVRPGLVYHYTTDAGLFGILSSGQLRVSDVFSLNDPSELRHGIQPSIDALSALFPGEAGAEFAEALEEVALHNAHRIMDYYACCFSEASADLGQWRAYGANGHGFALGFDASALERGFAVHGNALMASSYPVEYSHADLVWWQSRIVQCAEPLLKLYLLDEDNELVGSIRQQLLRELAVKVTLVALLFKHQAYSNEQEWRFLIADGTRGAMARQYWPRDCKLVEYRSFDWRRAAPNSLAIIIIGPAAPPEAEQFVDDCLLRADLHGINVERSQIPYSG